jgi:hypothetical protein
MTIQICDDCVYYKDFKDDANNSLGFGRCNLNRQVVVATDFDCGAAAKTEEAFIRFLTKHGVYTAFMRNLAYTRGAVARIRNIKSWNEFKQEEDPEDWIVCSFFFDEADFPKFKDDEFGDKLHGFWWDLHEKWSKHD